MTIRGGTILIEDTDWRRATVRDSSCGVRAVTEKAFRPSPQIIKDMVEVVYPKNCPRRSVHKFGFQTHLLRHQNLQKFFGVVVDELNWIVYVVGEFCSKGCLDDALRRDSLSIDWPFKYSLLGDIAEVRTERTTRMSSPSPVF